MPRLCISCRKFFLAILIWGKWAVRLGLIISFTNNHFPLIFQMYPLVLMNYKFVLFQIWWSIICFADLFVRSRLMMKKLLIIPSFGTDWSLCVHAVILQFWGQIEKLMIVHSSNFWYAICSEQQTILSVLIVMHLWEASAILFVWKLFFNHYKH